MEIYIARQPIFNRDLIVYGYELLYRQSEDNVYSGIDDDQATAELIYNSFLVFGINDLTDGTKAFINFSKELIHSDVPFLLPKDDVVVEILERGETTKETINACNRMRDLGYKVAVDDFIFESKFITLLDSADIVKVEFNSVDYDIQRFLINRYKDRIQFLAEKIETREDYQMARDMGYDLFQGYFFSKPFMVKTKELAVQNANLYRIMEELHWEEPSYETIASIIQNDIGLTYKIFKLANSAYYGTKNKIITIRHALTYLGFDKIYQWVSLMMLKDFQNVENAELIKLSLIRAKLMDSLAAELYADDPEDVMSEYFFTGLFSFIDILLNKSMEDILKGMSLPENVALALLGTENKQLDLLRFIITYEKQGDIPADKQSMIDKIGVSRFMERYIDAIKWANSLNY